MARLAVFLLVGWALTIDVYANDWSQRKAAMIESVRQNSKNYNPSYSLEKHTSAGWATIAFVVGSVHNERQCEDIQNALSKLDIAAIYRCEELK